jgi:hypothetical protein
MDKVPMADKGGAAVAALLAGVAVVILWQAQAFTAFASIFPRAVGIALLLCSLLVLWRSLRGGRSKPDADHGGLMRSALLVVVMLAWVALLEIAGFALASWAGFLALALLANRDGLSAKRLAGFALAALVCVLLLQLLFQRGLDVRLPAGRWLPGLFG